MSDFDYLAALHEELKEKLAEARAILKDAAAGDCDLAWSLPKGEECPCYKCRAKRFLQENSD